MSCLIIGNADCFVRAHIGRDRHQVRGVPQTAGGGRRSGPSTGGPHHSTGIPVRPGSGTFEGNGAAVRTSAARNARPGRANSRGDTRGRRGVGVLRAAISVMSARELRERIRRRARYANLNIQGDLLEGLERYFLLLGKWNAKVNLTAFRLAPGGDDEAIDRLLLEPLVAAKHLPAHATSLLDAGSGGGSPAIPLKLAVPGIRLRMVEAKTRKAVFLREAVRELGLKEAEVETARFEELLPRPEMHESADVVSHQGGPGRAEGADHTPGLPEAGWSPLSVSRTRWRTACRDRHTPPCLEGDLSPARDLRSRLVVLEKVRIGPQ